jgi:hypothetical protein
MAVAFRSVGTVASADSGNVTPGLPTGWQADDIFILVIEGRDNVTVSLPAGWTKFGEKNSGTDCRLTMGWRRAVAGDTAPLVTHSGGSSIIARIAAFSGCVASGTPIDTPAEPFPSANGDSTTVTTNNFTPAVANEMIVFAIGQPSNTSFSGYSGTNPTFTEGFDSAKGTIPVVSIALAYGNSTSTSALGARTATSGASNLSVGALFGLKPYVRASLVAPHPVHRMPLLRQ